MTQRDRTANRTVLVNRAPVMTLWAAVVAERLGFDRDEALSLGRAVSGLNAQSKGRRLGIFKPHEEDPRARKKELNERLTVEVCGRAVPAIVTAEGVRAVSGGKPLNPRAAAAYLEGKFGDDLQAARAAMTQLAKSYSRAELGKDAYSLYERFRPRVPEGQQGWGAKGEMDLGMIAKLARDANGARKAN